MFHLTDTILPEVWIFYRKDSEAFGKDRKNGKQHNASRKGGFPRMELDIEFKEFADILKTNISPESGDGSFLTEMIDAYLREPTAQDLQKLKDEAQKKSRKRKNSSRNLAAIDV